MARLTEEQEMTIRRMKRRVAIVARSMLAICQEEGRTLEGTPLEITTAELFAFNKMVECNVLDAPYEIWDAWVQIWIGHELKPLPKVGLSHDTAWMNAVKDAAGRGLL